MSNMNKKTLFFLAMIVGIIAASAVFLVVGMNNDNSVDPLIIDGFVDETVVDEAMGFINSELLGGATATLEKTVVSDGWYELTISMQGETTNVLVNKNSGDLYLSPINKAEFLAAKEETVVEEESPTVIKAEHPVVELFVMSHCPFGTQAEKVLLPVIDSLKEDADFEIKYVHYAMHGERELSEQMTQECIKKQSEEEFYKYLSCFLGTTSGSEEESNECLEKITIDKEALATCVDELDKEYGVTEGLLDESTWLSGRFPLFKVHAEESLAYGVKGSPTLVINGEVVNSGRSPQEYLNTICESFVEQPTAC